MNTKPIKETPAKATQEETGAKETGAFEQAQAWRERMIATVQNPEATDWLHDLSQEKLIEEYQLDRDREQRIEACVVSGKFYNPFLYRPALQWRDENLSYLREKTPANDAEIKENAERIEWLKGLSGEDLLSAYELYQTADRIFGERMVGEVPETAVATPESLQEPHAAWYAELETLREHQRQAFDRQEEHEKLGEQEAADLIEEEIEATAQKACALESLILQTPARTEQGQRLQVRLAIEGARILNHYWSRDSYESACCQVLVDAAKRLLTLTPETAEEQE